MFFVSILFGAHNGWAAHREGESKKFSLLRIPSMVLSQSQSCAAAVELTNSLGEVSLLGVSERILHACSFSDDVTDTSSATLLKLLAGIGNNTRINV